MLRFLVPLLPIALGFAPRAQILPVAPALYADREAGPAKSGAFSAFEPAHVTGMGVADLVFVRDGEPYLMSAPGIFEGAARLSGVPGGSVTHDLRILPGYGPGASDAIALLGSYGLALWTLDRQVSPAAATCQMLEPSWAGLTNLQVGSFFSDGEACFVGYTPGDNSVRVVMLDTPGLTIVLTYSAAVLAAAAVDYDPALLYDELCVISADSTLRVDNLAAGTQASEPIPAATSALAVRVPSPVDDMLVAYVEGPGGNALLGRSTGLAPETTDLQDQALVDLAVADLTYDGYADVSFIAETGSWIDLLFHRGPLPISPRFEYAWNGGVAGAFPVGGALAPGERVRAAHADFDGDGDVDFALGYSSLAGVKIGVSQVIEAAGNPADPSETGSGLVPTFMQLPTLNANEELDCQVLLPALGVPLELEVLSWELRTENGERFLLPEGVRHACPAPVAGVVNCSPSVAAGPTPTGASHDPAGHIFVFRARYASAPNADPLPAVLLAYELDGATGRVITPYPELPPPTVIGNVLILPID